MKARSAIAAIVRHEGINFALTNAPPRRLVSRVMGRISRIEAPLLVRAGIAVWRLFTDLDLSEAETTQFASLRDCFTRKLRPGARPINAEADVLISPCDAIVVACGTIRAASLVQAKGLDYRLGDLLACEAEASRFEGGTYVTLRLTSSMYHRFHAPEAMRIEAIRHVWGDRWNVNPPALARVKRLYCRNERASLSGHLASGEAIALVPVAAVLVGGIRLAAIDLPPPAPGETRRRDVSLGFARGEEIGWFEHGSTIVLLVAGGFTPAMGIAPGAGIRMGQPLLRRVQTPGLAPPS